MHVLQLRKSGVAFGLTLLLASTASAQTRDVVSKEVSVGRTEATLVLEFADSDRLEISLDDGRVIVDGDVVGTYEPGGELDAEWRALLSEAVTLEDGPLSRMLSDWTVPADLAADLADAAQEIDRALEDAINGIDIAFDADNAQVSISLGNTDGLIGLLLSSAGALGALEDALEDLELDDEDFQVFVREDYRVDREEIFPRGIVMLDGELRVDGTVDGDVIISRGELDLRETGRIRGTARLSDSRAVRNEGRVDGGVVFVEDLEDAREEELRVRIREEVAQELRADLRNEIRNVTTGDDSFNIMAPFRPVIRGAWGVAEKIFTILLLGLVGALVIAFAGDNLDIIAETARRSPGRAGAVGMAGSFLLIPVWVLGTIALAVSIVGIPVLIAWVPLFPIAAGAAGVIGYLAVARNTGEWMADKEYPWTGWIRRSNSWMTMVGGLIGLMLAFIAANVISMLPFLGFFSMLLAVVGCVITFAAIQIGFGAVLLTRAGRRREYSAAYDDKDAAWEAAVRVNVGDDDSAAEAAANGEDDDA